MENKKAISMAIRTIIYIVLGLVVLTLLIVLVERQTSFFSETIQSIMGRSNVDSVVKACNTLALSESAYSYCCEIKEVKLEDESEILATCGQLGEKGIEVDELSCAGVGCVGGG